MTNKELESRLRRAFTNATPDKNGDSLPQEREMKGKVISMKTVNRSHLWVKRAAGIAAAFVLLLGGVLGTQMYLNTRSIASTIELDVNPGIEIGVNQKEKVLKVSALNAEGKEVLGDMDLTGSSLDVAVNALIGSMLRKGYLSDEANSVLVSVDSTDPDRGSELQSRLTKEISALLKSDTFDGAVISQTVNKDDELETLAAQYGITLGKAQLIRQLTLQNTQHTFEELVPLSINELNLLTESGRLHLENVQSSGVASEKAYIGEEKAKEQALAHAGVKAEDVRRYTWELDFDNGTMVYEIEFTSGNVEYDYDVDAVSGAIRKSEKERDDDAPAATPDNTQGGTQSGTQNDQPVTEAYVGEEKAKEEALAHAGVKADAISGYRCQLDRDDGIHVYDIDFISGGYEYDYEINAATGKVVKFEREKEKAVQNTQNQTTTEYIGEAKAKELALAHAGVAADAISGYRCEFDRPHYEIEFVAGGYEYDYDIYATTGKVVKFEREKERGTASNNAGTSATPDTNNGSTSGTSANTQYIGEAKAKELALTHAGVAADAIRGFKCEFDMDDGVASYEIEFESGSFEYECEIHATSGKVLKFEKDSDD